MTKTSAIGRWVRGSVWTLILVVPLACTMGDRVTGPSSEQDPFAEFDRIARPRPAPGIRLSAGDRISLSPASATKPTGGAKSKSSRIRAKRGGSITIGSRQTTARITVLKKSIERDTVIDMTLRGSSISTSLSFGPDGLQFNPSAIVDVITSIDGMDLDNLKAYLTSANGEVEEAPIQVYRLGRLVLIRTWVAHFTDEDFDDGQNEEGDPEC